MILSLPRSPATCGLALTLAMGAGGAAAQGLLAGGLAASAVSGSVGVGVSTLGFYGEGRVRPTPFVGARALGFVGPAFEFDDVEIGDGVTGDVDVDVKGLAVLGDFYPNAGGFHISGGVFFPNDDITGQFSGDGGDFEGRLEVENDAAPMVTLGYRQRFPTGLTLRAEAGLIVTGFELTSDSPNPLVQAEIDSANDDLDDVPGYPFVAVGVAYRF